MRVPVVGAAIVDAGRVLVARRSAAMPEAGTWEFPGGKVEPGERPEAALVRELDEELGVAIAVGPAVATSEVDRGPRRIVLTVYEASLVAGSPVAREHAELRWLAPHELADLEWAEADVPAALELARRLTPRPGPA